MNTITLAWKITVMTCNDMKEHNVTTALLENYPELRGKISNMVGVIAGKKGLVKCE